MPEPKVIFIGGCPVAYGSVEIRCNNIAEHLRLPTLLKVCDVADIPSNYDTFVCVKPDLPAGSLERLSQRGRVIWDVIDAEPPCEYVSAYITSTCAAKAEYARLGRIEVIPHHHCNFSGQPNPLRASPVLWIGSPHWQPKLAVDYEFFNTQRLSTPLVEAAYRRAGICLNLRGDGPGRAFHERVNSGVKLINCIGFGIPSISGDEAGYHEAGSDCTIFSEESAVADWLCQLQTDGNLAARLRQQCLKRAADYHISRIVKMYQRLFATL